VAAWARAICLRAARWAILTMCGPARGPLEVSMLPPRFAELAQLSGILHGLIQPSGGARDLVAVAALALAALAVAVVARSGKIAFSAGAVGPLAGRATSLRVKAWSAAFQRQRDPDAAGRARPRAPSAAPAAA
jgi:phage-related tail protein